jgi:hypothetical protein
VKGWGLGEEDGATAAAGGGVVRSLGAAASSVLAVSDPESTAPPTLAAMEAGPTAAG